jgi:hypothetical protein
MKRFGFLFLFLFIVSSLISCRKGPEDPLFSLTTRKNRISKEWTAFSYKVNGVEKILEKVTINIEQGDCGTQTIQRYDSLSIFLDFRKSGEFFDKRCEVLDEQSTVTNPSSPGCESLVFTKSIDECTTSNGFWNFSGGVGNTSSREQVFIYVQETGVGILWDIVRLANDELKLKRRYIKSGESTFTTEEIWLVPVE